MLVAMWVCYYVSLPKLTLSAAAAAYYTLPIFITLFSALFIGSKISQKGWLAVFAGFSGVVLILRPRPATSTHTLSYRLPRRCSMRQR